jgi:hypothetical protein
MKAAAFTAVIADVFSEGTIYAFMITAPHHTFVISAIASVAGRYLLSHSFPRSMHKITMP